MIAPKDQQIQAFLSQRAFKTPNLFCESGNKVDRCCSNSECKYDSFCCSEEQCPHCEQLHSNCFYFFMLKKLNKSVQDRLFVQNKFLRHLFAIENDIINRLIANRREMIEKSKEWKLGESSKVIDEIYFKKNTKGLRGKDMKELVQDLLSKSNIQIEADSYLQSYKAEGEQTIKKLEKLRRDLIENLAKSKKGDKKEKVIRIDERKLVQSKIYSDDKDNRQKYQYLLKELSGFSQIKLLYRASQNKFSAAKFHQCCDGQSDTLTIVRTQFGKTIAAYTPLKWSNDNKWATDDLKRTFLFQLQLKQKMSLAAPQYAIYHSPNSGPIFGGGNDIRIADQCNQNQNSFSNFATSFNLNNKYQNNQQSWTAFCGNPNGSKFKVVEYEVFALSK